MGLELSLRVSHQQPAFVGQGALFDDLCTFPDRSEEYLSRELWKYIFAQCQQSLHHGIILGYELEDSRGSDAHQPIDSVDNRYIVSDYEVV